MIGDGGVGRHRQQVSADVDLAVVDGAVEGGVARRGVFGVHGRLFDPNQPLHQTLLAHRGCHLEQGSALSVNLKNDKIVNLLAFVLFMMGCPQNKC